MAVGITGDSARAGSAPDGVPGPRRGVHRLSVEEVEEDAGQGTVTVAVSGELDAAAAPALAVQLAQIVAHRPQRLVFDLTGLYFLDCASARLIVGLSRPAGRRPVIRGARPVVRRVLQVSGLAARCELEDEPPGPGS